MTPSHPTQMDQQSGEMPDSNCGLSVGRSSSEDLPPALPEVTQDEVIELAQALEQRRGLQIVDDVHNLPVGGREELMPTAFHAGWCGACEEIEYRLRTEEWELCLAPHGAACEASAGAQPSNEKAVDAFAALLASHQRLAEALRSVAATSSDISDETLTQYASGEFDHQTTAEAKAMLATRAALASIPKETT